MSAVSIALVLVSAFAHAGWNQKVHGGADRVAIMAVAYTTGGLMISPAVFVDPPTGVWWLIFVAIGFQFAYQVLMVASYGRGDLSLTYPVARGISPLLVALGGLMLLGQTPDATTVVGLIVLTSGLLGLALMASGSAQLGAVVLAALTGVAITGYTITDARAVRDVSPVGYFAVVALGTGVLALAAARIHPGRVRAVLGVGTAVGALQVFAYVLVLLALERAQAGQVASLRQVSVVIGVVIAGEAARRRAFLWASLVALGAGLVAW